MTCCGGWPSGHAFGVVDIKTDVKRNDMGYEQLQDLFKYVKEADLDDTVCWLGGIPAGYEEELKQKCGHANFHYLVADFLDLTTVERAADEFIAKGVPLHVLVNNAGTMESPFELSKQGIESTFAVNHFAAVVFTMRLLPTLAPKARIVNLSSLAHSGNIPAGGIRYEDLNNEAFYVSTGGDQRYGETKLANLHFTKFLQQYFDKSERDIFVNAVHPGIIKTNIFDNAPWYLKYSPFPYIDVSNGALTQIFVAGDDRIEKENYKGEYIACYCTKTIPSNDATNQDLIDQTAKWTKRILQDQFRKDWSW
ncbi:hypothetical protein HDV02_003844 [Globomyces sp. JEL0801]|nr:hypothetical protein HDV02_003844 [Globomyces sp. JEL0801]